MGSITPNVGLITGIPIQQTIDQLIAVQSRPRDLLALLGKKVEAEQVAMTTLSASLLSLQFQAINVGKPDQFSQTSTSSSNAALLSVTSTGNPSLGSFQFTPLQTAQSQQLLSSGLASDTGALGGGSFSFRFGGYVDTDTDLEILNAGAGVERGRIRITDRSGASAEIDLRFARTVDDVLEEVNKAAGINVQLEVRGDQFVLTDNTGSSGNLRVQELTGGTAASLGLGGVNIAASEVVGQDVFRLFDELNLDLLNDGNGVRFDDALPELQIDFRDGSTPLIIDFNKLGNVGTQAAATTNAANGSDAQVKITAVAAGVDLNGVTIVFQDDPSVTAGSETVFYDANTSTLTFKIDEGNTTANNIVDTLNDDATASAVFTAATPSGGTGTGLIDATDSALTADGTDPVPNGDEKTLGDVLATLNAADPARLAAAISADGERIELTDLTSDTGGTFGVTALFGTLAADDLGILGTATADTVTGQRIYSGLNTTLLRNLNGISGISDLGLLDLTDRSGASATIDLASVDTLQEVIDAINTAGVGIRAEVNDARNGIRLEDTTGATASNLIVANGDINTTTADKLGITVDDAVDDVNSGSLKRRVISENTRLDSLNGGRGVNRGRFRVTDTNGTSGTVDLQANSSIETIGDIVRQIELLGLGLDVRVNDAGDGIVLIDTAEGGGVFQVTDVSGTTAKDLQLTSAAKTVSIDGENKVVIDASTTFNITLGASDSLDDLIEQINDLGAGVSASKFVDGSTITPFRLSLLSQQSGASGALLVDSSGLGFTVQETAAAQDALLLFGTTDVSGAGIVASSSTGTFNNVLPGVSVTINGVSEDPVTINVKKTSSTLTAGILALVSTFNTLRDQIDQLTAFDEVELRAGLLLGDGNVLRVETDLSNLISGRFFGVGSVQSLKEVGIDLDGDGQLSFDQTVFDAALAADPSGVEDFFSKKDVGFSDKLNNLINTLAGEDTSLLSNRITSLGTRVDDINRRIDFMEERLAKSRELLLNSFNQLELAVAKQQVNLTALSALQIIPPL